MQLRRRTAFLASCSAELRLGRDAAKYQEIEGTNTYYTSLWKCLVNTAKILNGASNEFVQW